jgi:hypothetical protein
MRSERERLESDFQDEFNDVTNDFLHNKHREEYRKILLEFFKEFMEEHKLTGEEIGRLLNKFMLGFGDCPNRAIGLELSGMSREEAEAKAKQEWEAFKKS